MKRLLSLTTLFFQMLLAVVILTCSSGQTKVDVNDHRGRQAGPAKNLNEMKNADSEDETIKSNLKKALAGHKPEDLKDRNLIELIIEILFDFEYKDEGRLIVSPTLFPQYKAEIDARSIIKGKETSRDFDNETQDKIGLAAMASMAAYDRRLDKGNFPDGISSMASDEFYHSLITMPRDAREGKMPEDESDVYDSLGERFNITTVLDSEHYALALLVDANIHNQRYGIIAVRGTITPPVEIKNIKEEWEKVLKLVGDWMNCMNALPIELVNDENKPVAEWVHNGFYRKPRNFFYYTSAMQEFVKKIMDDPKARLIITGHSQGGVDALALVSMMLAGKKYNLDMRRTDLITFAQPSFGTSRFVKWARNKGLTDNNYMRFVREGDIVTIVPGDVWKLMKGVPAEQFGNRKYMLTGLNPIKRLSIPDTGAMIHEILLAHNAGEYLAWAYHCVPAFVQDWKWKNKPEDNR